MFPYPSPHSRIRCQTYEPKYLARGKSLDPKHRDHALVGEWKNCRDCHIEPDRVLIYSADKKNLRLERTGTHSDLFKQTAANQCIKATMGLSRFPLCREQPLPYQVTNLCLSSLIATCELSYPAHLTASPFLLLSPAPGAPSLPVQHRSHREWP